MEPHKTVSHDDWIRARRALLEKEKEYTRARDALTQDRQALPWEKVEKDYRFEGEDGEKSLANLFDGRSQLIVYHFMFGPDWEEGCPSCSFWADSFNGTDIHLAHRDTTLIAVSNTSLEKIDAYKARMGWTFKWVSSLGTDFNRDFYVTFTDEQVERGEMYYNYRMTKFPVSEAPGLSAFYQGDDGNVYHTYSTYARGLDILNGAYNMLDLTALGRHEDGKGMAWLRRKDQYED
jgi:predicted dithiol-disulfide oxidoreductase (DUF899 family)